MWIFLRTLLSLDCFVCQHPKSRTSQWVNIDAVGMTDIYVSLHLLPVPFTLFVDPQSAKSYRRSARDVWRWKGERERRKKQLKDKSRGSRWNSGASDLAPGMLYRRRRRLGWIYRERSRQIGWRTLLSVAGSLTAGRPAQPSISFSISSRLRLLILLPVQTVDQKPAIAGSSLMPTGCGSVDWRIADRGRKESDGGNL